jgi:hypothetical protein
MSETSLDYLGNRNHIGNQSKLVGNHFISDTNQNFMTKAAFQTFILLLNCNKQLRGNK